jgi:hypothetical protein
LNRYRIPNEINKSLSNFQQNIGSRLDQFPNSDTFQLIINDKATAIVNEFKNFMQDLDIKVSFELTNAIIRKNFIDVFSELTRVDNYNIDTFCLIQSSLKALPNFPDMDDLFSAMANTKFVASKFDEHYSLINNLHIEDCNQFSNTNSLITKGFDVLSGLRNKLMDLDHSQNFEMMEAMNHISINLQDGFRSLQIPANVITDALLTRVEGQYQVYLKRMTIQMQQRVMIYSKYF